jgi:nickel superoxide dismutase
MIRRTGTPGLVLVSLVLLSQIAHAHCQVPCGIYDDAARLARMQEDAATIEKAMVKIQELAGRDDAQSANQLTRWVMTKETHAANIITTVAEYFLTQKVKPVPPGTPGYDAFLAMLADHHNVMVAAMKTKQNCDVKFAGELRQALDGLGRHYDVGHLEEHH